MTGRVVVVGTPIGNLGDLSPRAVAALAAADVICCEDTRRTRQLLTAAGLQARRLEALHAHNEAAAVERAVRSALGGKTVALVSDAGMPVISDPGERLVRAAADAGVPVEVVPGPSAALAGLVVSGLPAGRFCFEGFLPRKGAERAARLAALAVEPRTSVLYEAPHRVARTFDDLTVVCGPDRPVVAARELTKLHEQVWRGTLEEAVAWVSAVEPRGEWVLVLGGAPETAPAGGDVDAALRVRLAGGMERRAAVADVAASLGVARRLVYQAALDLEGG